MATADQYAEWIVANQDKKGTPEFDTVAAAYKEARAAPAAEAPQEEQGFLSSVASGIGNLGAGALRGAGSIGSTILAPYDWVTGQSNADRRKGIDEGLRLMGADPSSLAYGAGKLGTEVAGTMGVGGGLANVVGRAAPQAVNLTNALRTSGLAKGVSLPMNVAGGAAAGAGSAELIEPGMVSGGLGGAIGGTLPLVNKVAAPVAQAVAARFGNKKAIAARGEAALNAAAKGNEQFAINAMDTAQTFVPGATPTMAEALAGAQTPNAIQGGRLMALQRSMTGARGIEDVIPSAMRRQDTALKGALEPYAGGATPAAQEAAIDAATASRESAGNALYGPAYASDFMRRDLEGAQRLQQAAGIGQATASEMPTPGLMALTNRPAFNAAMKDATEGLKNAGSTDVALNGLEGLHRIKISIDDALSGAAPQSAASKYSRRELIDIKNALLNEMESLSPMYRNARQVFAQESAPINQLQVNRALLNTLENSAGEITPRQFLTAADTGEAALLKKSGVPRFAGGIRDILDPQNMAAVEGVASHLGRRQDLARMLRDVKPNEVGTELPAVPHVGAKLIYADALRKAINGQKVNQFIAESMTDPAAIARLLRGLPADERIQMIRQISQQVPVAGAAQMGSQQ